MFVPDSAVRLIDDTTNRKTVTAGWGDHHSSAAWRWHCIYNRQHQV